MKRNSVMAKSIVFAASVLVVIIVARGLLLAPATSANNPSQPPIPLDWEAKVIEPGKNLAQQIAASNNDFGFDMFRTLISSSPTEKNVIFSPFSISVALSLALAGARSQTANEIQSTLHLPSQTKESPSYLAASLSARLAESLSKITTERSEHSHKKDKEGEAVLLKVANSVWAQQGLPFEPDFLQTLDQEFHAPLQQTDFVHNTKKAVQDINGWVSKQTRNKIDRLISENALNKETALVILNAIYFKGSWAVPFKPELTHESDFTLSDKSTVKASFLKRVGSYSYYSDDESHGRQPKLCSGCKVVEVPYFENSVSMLLILPSETSASIDLDATSLSAIRQSLKRKKIDLSLPKFEFNTDLELMDSLKSMGMVSAFDRERADFSGIIKKESETLWISKVLHKAFVSVDEQGTEAAAATAVVMAREMMVGYEPPGIVVRFDRPFYFVIQSTETGAALFVGRVVDPTQK
eukprot:TRINITY_DN2562_c0_g1_i2.p1 TRINITY_DN2562_c0_g1~~TRINITY_DN2562_c0_g1_i2.p1  ORF type:complete len:467 (-),score=91.86 TRINITY_DN2562_c0_g1_i2:154-1554(-)